MWNAMTGPGNREYIYTLIVPYTTIKFFFLLLLFKLYYVFDI